jgi:hypothetical protein
MTIIEKIVNYFYGTETDTIPALTEYTPLPEPPRNFTVYPADDTVHFKTVIVGAMLEERHTDISITVNERIFNGNS